jgi:hypothetical protein
MMKLFALVRKHESVSDADFRRYWSGEFLARLRSSPAGRKIRRIVLNQVVEHDFRPGTNAAGHVWHGVGEYYVDHEAVAVQLLGDASFAVAASGDPSIVSEVAHIPMHEIQMYDNLRVANPVRVYGFFQVTLPGMGRADAHSYWASHMEVANEQKADTIVRKYVQNATFLNYHNPDPRYDYDGASCIWCDTREDAGKIYHNPALMDLMKTDEINMGCVPEATVYVRTDEVSL